MLRHKKRHQIALALNRGFGILVPLNKKPPSERTRKLEELVRILREIERVEGVHAAVEMQLRQDRDYLPSEFEGAPNHAYAKANEILAHFHWSPRVASPPNQAYSFTWRARTRRTDWENKFVFWLLNLRARGDVCLLRNCRNCRIWFYAVTNHQAYCTNRCRQQFHSRDMGFKDNRRLYMRSYRKKEKLRDLAALQSVARDGKTVRTVRPRTKKGG